MKPYTMNIYQEAEQILRDRDRSKLICILLSEKNHAESLKSAQNQIKSLRSEVDRLSGVNGKLKHYKRRYQRLSVIASIIEEYVKNRAQELLQEYINEPFGKAVARKDTGRD